MAATVKLLSGGMAELLMSGEMYGILEPKAQAVLSAAQGGAPVASGEYRQSLHLERDTTDRAVVRVVADAPHAMIVEANTGNLARAL